MEANNDPSVTSPRSPLFQETVAVTLQRHSSTKASLLWAR